MGAGAVGIDIVNILRSHACILHGVLHGTGCAASVLCRGSDVEGVTGGAVSNYLCQDIGSSGLCMFQGLQHYHAGSLAHNKTISVLVKGDGCPGSVLCGVQGCKGGKSRNADRGNAGLCSAGHHHVRLAVLNGTERLTDGMGSGCACSYHVEAFSLKPELDGNIACGHVAYHEWHQKGVHTAGSLLVKLLYILFHGLERADAGSHAHAYSVGILLLHINAGLLQGFLGCCHRKLRKCLHTAGCLGIHVLFWIKSLYLCCQLALIIGCIKISNGADSNCLILKSLPEALHIISNGSNGTHTGYYYSCFHTISLLFFSARKIFQVILHGHSAVYA